MNKAIYLKEIVTKLHSTYCTATDNFELLLFVLFFWETCQTLLILIFSLFVLDISLNVNQSLSEGHQLTFNLFKAQRGYLILNKAMMIKKSRAHLAMQKLQQVKCTRSKWKLYRKYLPLPLPWENMHPYEKWHFAQFKYQELRQQCNGSKGHENFIRCLFKKKLSALYCH